MDGVRSGNGSCYEDGVLVYEGAFANGLYEGMGSLFKDGVLCYRGSFVAGLQEGDGHRLLPQRTAGLCRRPLAEGLYEGEGTEYWESGQVRYRGSFAQGLYDGSGALYLERTETRSGASSPPERRRGPSSGIRTASSGTRAA